MAKKTSRNKKPNLPKDVLERARQQVGAPDTDAVDVSAAAAEMPVSTPPMPEKPAAKAAPTPKAVTAQSRPQTGSNGGTRSSARSTARSEMRTARRPDASGSSATRRRPAESIQYSKDKRRRAPEALDLDEIAELLANPTRMVTDEQMRQEYGHVLRDIRSMALLAAVLFIVMLVIASFIV